MMEKTDIRAKAEEYLEKHRITELFTDLCTAVSFHKPVDVRKFLTEELKRRVEEGKEAGVFEDAEIDAVFQMSDLNNSGFISQEQCRKALMTLSSSMKQYEEAKEMTFPNQDVDLPTFQEYAKRLLKTMPKM
ncbi:unnamed protein product [Vitrella brassicaformis CCMP3155]|uniref:EF-hand domain-containing protein n=1 Tax=Vitrella brassicaformis (strain CCMP3155) TaxID=1169540 RepID=A0A0G4FWA7_VITBC|nr:unnamed protein product [Vitrella brassicaformis CCMP3155]|eukprot:CEM19480.1 unnamed protein product [Vitrella brassicaformis CCMP3155]